MTYIFHSSWWLRSKGPRTIIRNCAGLRYSRHFFLFLPLGLFYKGYLNTSTRKLAKPWEIKSIEDLTNWNLAIYQGVFFFKEMLIFCYQGQSFGIWCDMWEVHGLLKNPKRIMKSNMWHLHCHLFLMQAVTISSHHQCSLHLPPTCISKWSSVLKGTPCPLKMSQFPLRSRPPPRVCICQPTLGTSRPLIPFNTY